MDLVTREEARQFLDQKSGDANDLTAQLVTHISRMLAAYTGRYDWGPASERTEYADGDSSFVHVHYWPVALVTAIYVDQDHVFGSDTLETSTNYHIAASTENGGVIYWETGKLPKGFENVKIVYTGGYATTAAIPGDVKTACLLQLQRDSLRRQAGAYAGKESDWPLILPEVKALLRPYIWRAYLA